MQVGVGINLSPQSACMVLNWAQMQDFLTTTTDRLQAKTEQLKHATSDAMANAITSSTHDWLQAHPVALQTINVILWAINRPIISLVLLLVAIAIAISIIKAINRLLEIAGLSLLKAPFWLSQSLIKLGYQGGNTTVNRWFALKKTQNSPPAVVVKEQRLKEISTRLNELQQEHNELLHELIVIVGSEQVSQDNQ